MAHKKPPVAVNAHVNASSTGIRSSGGLAKSTDVQHNDVVVVTKPLHKLQRHFNRHEDVNTIDAFGRTALHYVCEAGDVRLIRMVIGEGAHIEVAGAHEGLTGLMIAAQHGHLDAVRDLYERGARRDHKAFDGRTLLHLAADNASTSTVLTHLLRTSHTAVEDMKARDDAGLTPLYYAAQAGNLRSMETLLDRGADWGTLSFDATRREALRQACADGNAEKVKSLLHNLDTKEEDPRPPPPHSHGEDAERTELSEKSLLALVPLITATLKKLKVRETSCVDETIVAEALLAEWRSSSLRRTLNPPDTAQLGATQTATSKKKKKKSKKKKQAEKSSSGDQLGKAKVTTAAAGSADATVILLGQNDSFPFHVAVQKSHGDLEAFGELLEVLVSHEDSAATKMPMLLHSVSSARESLSAIEYAYSRGYHEIGDYFVARMQLEEGESETAVSPFFDKVPALSVRLLEEVGIFGYWYIHNVDSSRGDVDQCKFLCRAMDPTGHSIHERIQADVVRERSETVSWSALGYASYLGYDKIVDFLLKRQKRNPTTTGY